jgi:hypothetical protein
VTVQTLQLPIACVVGDDCWFSNRPDVGLSGGVRDHAGQAHSYEEHDDTDLAVRHTGQAVATWVVAPAAGRVVRLRDGVVIEQPRWQLVDAASPMAPDTERDGGWAH